MKIKKTDELEFRCPKCYSSYFGVGSDDVICCHGENRCGFRSNMKDKWKFFVRVEKIETVFENKEELEELERINSDL